MNPASESSAVDCRVQVLHVEKLFIAYTVVIYMCRKGFRCGDGYIRKLASSTSNLTAAGLELE